MVKAQFFTLSCIRLGLVVAFSKQAFSSSSDQERSTTSDRRRPVFFQTGLNISLALHQKLCSQPEKRGTLFPGRGAKACLQIVCDKASLLAFPCGADCESEKNCHFLQDVSIISHLLGSASSPSKGIGSDKNSVLKQPGHLPTNYTSNEEGTTWDPRQALCLHTNNSGLRLPLRRSCEEYVECVGEIPLVRACPPGQIFNAASSACIKGEDDIIACLAKGEEGRKFDEIIRFTRSSPRRLARKVTSFPNKFQPCAQSGHYVRPHPTNCSKFQICSNGKTRVEDCGPGTLFHPLELTCDFPHHVDCSDRQINYDSYDCQPEDSYKTSHPDYCEQFIECDQGELHVKSCPPSTKFDYEEQTCRHSSYAKCMKTKSLEKDEEEQPGRVRRRRRRQILRKIRFDCSFNYIAPHPEFCNKFVECEDKRVFIKDCGPGTAYNPNLGQCDWPHNLPRRAVPNDCLRYEVCNGRRYVQKECGNGRIFRAVSGKCGIAEGLDYEENCSSSFLTPKPN